MTNPWQALDHSRIDEFGSTDRRERAVEHEMTDVTYRGTEQYTRPCVNDGCTGTMYYRDTVGALQCDTDRALAHMNGEPIRRRQAEAES